MANYVALLHKSIDGGYCVSFPDFPACITGGDTLEEARVMATHALDLHVKDFGKARFPAPTKLDAVMADPDNFGVAILYVYVSDPKVKHLRYNVTLPEDLAREIDREASARGLHRSTFLAQAAERELRNRAA